MESNRESTILLSKIGKINNVILHFWGTNNILETLVSIKICSLGFFGGPKKRPEKVQLQYFFIE